MPLCTSKYANRQTNNLPANKPPSLSRWARAWDTPLIPLQRVGLLLSHVKCTKPHWQAPSHHSPCHSTPASDHAAELQQAEQQTALFAFHPQFKRRVRMPLLTSAYAAPQHPTAPFPSFVNEANKNHFTAFTPADQQLQIPHPCRPAIPPLFPLTSPILAHHPLPLPLSHPPHFPNFTFSLACYVYPVVLFGVSGDFQKKKYNNNKKNNKNQQKQTNKNVAYTLARPRAQRCALQVPVFYPTQSAIPLPSILSSASRSPPPPSPFPSSLVPCDSPPTHAHSPTPNTLHEGNV